MKPVAHSIGDYAFITEIQTRWNDNDKYGHINNAVYYMYFDTIVNNVLIDNGLLPLIGDDGGKSIGLVVDTGCQYFSSLAYPETIRVGVRVGKLGNSSVRYELALFSQDSETAAAQGHFVHVYVDEENRKPKPISTRMREVLTGMLRA